MNENEHLSMAATLGDVYSALAAVKAGADINHTDGQPLKEAVAHQHTDLVQALAHLGADVNQANGRELTTAIKAKDLEMVQTLIALGANVNQPRVGFYGMPLAKAAATGNMPMFNTLLAAGAGHHAEAITAAVTIGHTPVLQALKSHGIAVQVQAQDMTTCLSNRHGETALWILENCDGLSLSEHQVLTAVHNDLHQVINHVMHHTDYLPSDETYDSLAGTRYSYFLHGIANRELNKRLSERFKPKAKEQIAKI
jgi:hypothetical protein